MPWGGWSRCEGTRHKGENAKRGTCGLKQAEKFKKGKRALQVGRDLDKSPFKCTKEWASVECKRV